MARESVDQTKSDILSVTGVVTDDEFDEGSEEANSTPSYVLVGSASIPVSKKAGARWEERIKDALTAYDWTFSQWAEANKEFRRTGAYAVPLDDRSSERPQNYFGHDTDENLVRENVKIMLRNTYTRNPSIELSTIDGTDSDMIDVLKAVINQLLGKTHYPGLNAKARIRRWLTHAHLTNFGVVKLDYQAPSGSQAEGFERLLTLQEKLSKAKNDAEMDELYAELEMVEEELPTLRMPGILLQNRQSGMILVDPDCENIDLSDAKWMAECVFIADAYIKKKFLEKNEDGVWVRKTDGKPPGGNFGGKGRVENKDDLRETIADQILGAIPDELAKVRQKDKTKCWIVWDKMTRQISLWIDGAWGYPLWVYQDDLKLSRFYPYFIHAFTNTIDGIVQEGEASQYAGHAREINKINKRVAFVRMLAFGQLIYNSKKVERAEVDKIVKHMKDPTEFEALGIAWDPEMKLSEMFDMFVPPDAQLQQLYDKSDLMRVVDRMNAVSPAQRGEQFKTNTTNKAVASYEANQASVVNELTDAIEDSISDLVHAMCELIVSKYTKEQVISIIGSDLGSKFEPMEVVEFNQQFFLQIASGSMEKPTSDNRKKEAMEIAQAVGQVGQATPMTAMKIIFRMFKQAFSNFSFTSSDEKMLEAEATANMNKGVSTPQGQTGAPPVPTQGAK